MASGGDYRALSPSPTVGVGRSPRMPPPPPAVAVAAGPTIGVGTASKGAARTNVTMGVGTTPLVKQPGRGDRSLNQAQMQYRDDGETILTPNGWYNCLGVPSRGEADVMTASSLDTTHDDYKALSQDLKNMVLGRVQFLEKQ